MMKADSEMAHDIAKGMEHVPEGDVVDIAEVAEVLAATDPSLLVEMANEMAHYKDEVE